MLAVLRGLAWAVYDKKDRRLRALWRIVAQLAVLAVVWPLTEHAFSATDEATEGAPETYFALAPLYLVSAGVVVWSVWFAARYLDRRPPERLGLGGGGRYWLDLSFGVALGGALMAGIFAAEVTFGLSTYAEAPEIRGDVPRWAFVPVTAFAFISIGVTEELVFRGYQLTNLAEGLTSRWMSPATAVLLAVALSSGVFGLAHAANPHAGLLSTGNIAIGGLMLAAGYVLTGELAIPIGLHIGWNFFQNLLGMPVSGQTRFHFGRLLAREVDGPEWITGGSFGPEAGLTGLVAMVLGTLFILVWVRVRRGPLRIQVPCGVSESS